MAGVNDRIEEAKKALAAMTTALEQMASKAEREAKERSEMLAQPELKAALDGAKLFVRAETIRADAEVKAKRMKGVQSKAAKAIDRVNKQLEAFAKRRP